MGSRLSDMETKLGTVSSTVSNHDHDIQDLKNGLNMMGERVQSLTPMINNQTTTNYKLIYKLEQQVDDIPNRNRRNNIIINRVPEESKETQSCWEFLSSFFTDHMKLEGGDEIEVERAHRIPGRRAANTIGNGNPRPRLIHC